VPFAYVSVATLKAASPSATTGHSDAELRRLAEAGALAVDAACGRTFRTYLAARYFTRVQMGGDGIGGPLQSDGPGYVAVPDLLSATELATDTGSGAYTTLWAATDYYLDPRDNPVEGKPYSRVVRATGGRYTFPAYIYGGGVRLTGSWGYSDATEPTGASLSAGVIPTAPIVPVTDATLVSPGDTLLLEAEQVYVLSISANNLTCQRGVNGTTAATHAGATPVSRYVYPAAVVADATALALGLLPAQVLATAASSGIRSERVGDIAVEYAGPTTGTAGERAAATSPRARVPNCWAAGLVLPRLFT
jgi:hypothetical protein